MQRQRYDKFCSKYVCALATPTNNFLRAVRNTISSQIGTLQVNFQGGVLFESHNTNCIASTQR